ncbi:DUF695 domain-containing protein [Paenibacillus albiflavus]|uniref:DUF695 domain-containing protein n=1 Tax=Paenibacillus albiflavus TaxID=2545760 RepID=A0A4R4DZH7_9BACL|nr:DUF695 domain-containing protein [Paenibacillus albiflavus]TCZ71834.1 DUF695 domain-containing protein [Paenibacillus albiflavus]
MSEHWDIYLTQSNNNNVFVRLDLGIKDSVPISGADKLVQVSIQTKSLFSKKMNFELLHIIEDEIGSALTESDFYIGVITEADMRTFYIYTIQEKKLLNTVESILSKHKKQTSDISIVDDPEWSFYLETLYPDVYKYQWIQDRHVVEQLIANNDNQKVPREITHWLYFSDIASRESYKNKLDREVYKIIDETTFEEETDYPYQLSISHKGTTELETIYQYTTELIKKSLEVGGNYDGWETQVIQSK